MNEILVITCPGGKQSSTLIPLVYETGRFQLRLAAHSVASQKALQEKYPTAEVVTTDLTSLSECQSLLKGASAIYAVHPSFHSREKEIGFNLIDAAVAESQRTGNSFKHYVCSTVLGTQHRNLQQHDLKSFIEERLFLSPLECWTIVKPTNFMDAYPVALLNSQDKPVFERLWNVDGANSLIALRDLADAVLRVLLEREKHFLGEYPLSGTMPLSDRQVVSAIAARIGKQIDVRSPTFEVGVDKILNYLFGSKAADLYAEEGIKDFAFSAKGDLRGDLTRDAAERLILFYNRRGLKGSPNILRWLLGREPTSIHEWIDLQLAQ